MAGQLAIYLCWLVISSVVAQAYAQTAPITSSGLNTRVGAPTTLHNGQTTYDITGGTRPGGGTNLFHSFGTFNVPTNNIANFLNDAGLATSNILGRVTGGNPSNIFGTIQTTGFGSANLFLMNPAGIVFGPNATLNIGGSATFTTADYLRLADGAKFNAVPGIQDASVSAAPVAAFGFLGSNPGAITVQGGQLSVPNGASLSLVGGDITIQSGTLNNGAIQPAHLSAPNGRIHLASAASAGEILSETLDQGSNINGQSVGALGTIQLLEKSILDTGGGGGAVSIRGGRFVMNDSTIAASSINPTGGQSVGENGGAVTISASTVQLENGAMIQANAENAGSAGRITIQGIQGQGSAAANVTMNNAALSTTITGGSAASSPGAITITADNVTLNNGTYITADTLGAAPAGHITFNVGSLIVKGSGPIRLHVVPESLITNPIISETGVLIESTSRSPDAGAGPGGQVTIQGLQGPGSMAGSVSLADTIIHARVFGGTAATTPAAITVSADSLSLTDQVELYTTSNGPAPAGNVALNINTLRSNVNPDGSFVDGRPVLIGSPSEKPDSTAGPPGIVTISGPGAGSTDPAKEVTLSNTEIDTFVVSGSKPPVGQTPGPIIVTAETVSLNNLTIFVTTSGGAAPAGNILFNADTFLVNVRPDGTPITSASRVFLNSPSGSLDSTGGPPGSVTISGLGPGPTDAAKSVTLYNAQISSATEGGRSDLPPGIITITADTVTMSGRTEIFAFSTGPAPAGNIALNVNNLRANVRADGTLINDGQPRSLLASVGADDKATAGRAGTVTISGPGPEATDSAKLIALNNMEVSTNVTGGTTATLPGTITMNADTVSITNSRNIHTDTLGAAPAGNIIVNANNLTVGPASKISSSTSGAGSGGAISITAGQFVNLSDRSSITASSTGPGNAGNIAINAGSQFLSNNSSITTQASQASGGNITIQATDAIRLVNSQINTSVQGGPTTAGGNIILDPAVVTLQNSQVLAEAVQGQGGNISIIAGTFLADQTSAVSASSQFGLSGSVNIQSPIANLSGTLTILPQQPLQVHRLLQQRCAAQASGKASSFVVAGRDILPSEPGGWLMSPMAFVTGETSPVTARSVETRSDESLSRNEVHFDHSVDQFGRAHGRAVTGWTGACGS